MTHGLGSCLQRPSPLGDRFKEAPSPFQGSARLCPNILLTRQSSRALGMQLTYPAPSPLILQIDPFSLSIRNQILKFGEDWIFLFLLGICMATISFGLDVTTSKFQRGSGIPELKVTLRGVVLAEFFTFRTFVAKLIGVICTLAAGSTIFLGKVGPFVHMATILATLLGKVMVKFAGTKENPGRKYEMLIAGAAVGVACCFVAPVGGVLFSVETTATHFAVRNYWRGFFAATCAALMFRLLAVVNNERETVAVLFTTNWRVEFPFDLPEFLSFAILGVVCGCLCCVYLFCHRTMLIFMLNHEKISKFLNNNKILYTGFVALVLASITFPHGLGQCIGSRLSMKEHLETFFNNLTWGVDELLVDNSTKKPPHPTYEDNWRQWTHSDLSSLQMLTFFIILKFFMVLLATTTVVPAGYFLPVFVYGAGLGRLYGEIMAKIFPEGIISEGIHIKITPSGYALAGAAAFSGAVTHTISTALLVFELTGQMSHILPVLIAVLIANVITQRSQPSFFDGIIIVKKLPYLPKLTVGKSGAHDIYAEDFMVTDLKYVAKDFKYKDIRNLLKTSSLKQFPLVDSTESKVLLGSIKRKPLVKLLSKQLSTEKRLQYLLDQSDQDSSENSKPSVEDKNSTRSRKADEGAALEELYEEDGFHTENEEDGIQLRPSKLKRFHLYYTMVEEWECRQLQETIRLDDQEIDPAPYRLVEKETLYQCYDLFNLLGLRIAYVTSTGRLVGVVGLNQLKEAVDSSVKGTFTRKCPPRQEQTETAKEKEQAKNVHSRRTSRVAEQMETAKEKEQAKNIHSRRTSRVVETMT
nr:PREDICTED: chloride channel protein ClC-Kb-like [Latimeria chalumnae]|eukprot:XP_014346129.1 PREDICTED: chloride channel protein ClC-Kb-like [Latimeria chalumnae]